MAQDVTFGLGLYTGQRASASTRPRYRDAIALARAAEEAGFDAFWVSEHHGMDDGYLPSPLALLAAIAAVTERITLGTGLVIAPLHHPLRIAEDAAVVDQVSGGRLVLGLGIGYVEGVSGRRDAARKVLGQLRERSRHELVPAYYLAVVHLGLGEKDECFAWLEKAYEEKNYDPLCGVKADRILDPLHPDPRYQDLLRRMGLPPD